MDSRDVALQSVMPTVMVPRYSELEELATAGDRILMAANGVWLEVCRAWLYARVLVAKPSIIPVPYGQVSEVMRFGLASCQGQWPLNLSSRPEPDAQTSVLLGSSGINGRTSGG